MKRLIILLFIFLSTKAFTQLHTFYGSAQNMVTWDFLGSDYIISNVTYTGAYYAIGSFDATATNIGLSQGIVLNTGIILGPEDGPVGPNDETNGGYDNGYPGNSLLSQYANGASTFNAAVLEFDFISTVDTLSFRFVFGSEEYPEYAPPNNSQFNDIFGIFISGPGISGIQNIAKLPNGAIVSINNINPITNSSYFVNNGDGTTAPYNSNDYYIQYDGFTDPILIKKEITPGVQYHLTFVIADVYDGIFDSGIFIESCQTCSFHASNESIDAHNNFKVYPNPANNSLKINFKQSDEYEIQLIDLAGNIISEKFVNGEEMQFEIESVPNGVYMIQIKNDEAVYFEKIVVQH